MNIIMLAGKSGAGKDVVADYIHNNYDYDKLAFADSLKEVVSKKYKFPIKYCYSQLGKKKLINGVSVRQLLISEAKQMRYENENIFVELLNNKIHLDCEYVISDFRYINEFNALKQYSNVKTINIIRNNCNIIDDPSEHQLDSFNFDMTIINNYKTINDLYKFLDTISFD